MESPKLQNSTFFYGVPIEGSTVGIERASLHIETEEQYQSCANPNPLNSLSPHKP